MQSTPAIADVDADGLPEVVTVAYPAGTTGSNMLIMLNGEDGSEELMIPDSTYNVRWGTGAAVGNLDGDAQGYPAIANLDSDPEAEVVIGGKWFDNDGTPMQDKGWIGCNGEWCITAVADSNDDGRLDIVSGNKVYNADGTLVWENSSAPDGFVAVADMTGDGKPDVISISGGNARVLSGVDVDADGNSEFIVPANDDKIDRDGCAVGTHGVFAFGDTNDKWVRTRQVWNQHSYHVTNVDAAGGIPEHENDSWSGNGLNNYRQNVQGEGVFNAPDLSVSGLSVNTSSCPSAARTTTKAAWALRSVSWSSKRKPRERTWALVID